MQCWLESPIKYNMSIYLRGNSNREAYERVFVHQSAWFNFLRREPVPTPLLHVDKEISTEELVAEYLRHTFVLCPSEMEGYGHYINQARAASAVIITTGERSSSLRYPSVRR